MKPQELFPLVLEELNKRGINPSLLILAGFIYGKYLSPYSYKDTPESLADSWQKCNVEEEASKLPRT